MNRELCNIHSYNIVSSLWIFLFLYVGKKNYIPLTWNVKFIGTPHSKQPTEREREKKVNTPTESERNTEHKTHEYCVEICVERNYTFMDTVKYYYLFGTLQIDRDDCRRHRKRSRILYVNDKWTLNFMHDILSRSFLYK